MIMGQLVMICRCGRRVELGWKAKAIPVEAVCEECSKRINAKIGTDVIRRGGYNGNLSIRADVGSWELGD